MVVYIIDMKIVIHFFINQHETELGKGCCKHENYDIHADTR
jgi:hypothetical protein